VNRKHNMGDLKVRMIEMDASKFTPLQAARHLGTSIATVYSLSQRYKVNFRKAGWGEYKNKGSRL